MNFKSSVILTVKNEASNLQRLLDSLAAQTLQPDEVVVCDGGSTDGTPDILRAEKRFPLQVLIHPGTNISQGRNAAIQAANGDIIAVTDAGVWLEPHWLEELVTNFRFPGLPANPPWRAPVHPQGAFGSRGAPGQGAGKIQNSNRLPNLESEILNLEFNVVAGFFVPDPHTPFEVAMSATVLPQLADINPNTFMPSSRSVAFTRQAWQAVGGYPEWLDFCEDLVFDFALHDTFGPFAFAPRAVAHFRPRGSLRAFFRQYYQYARGDGKANLFFKRHLIRYGTYLVVVPLVLLAGMFLSAWWWALYLLSIPFMFLTPYKRVRALWGDLSPAQRLEAALCIPLIRVTGDVAKMMGYPVGIVWRWRRAARKIDRGKK